MAFTGITTFSALGSQYCYWYVRNSGYPYGTTGLIAPASSAGGGRLLGVKSVAVTEPAPEIQYATGDNGVLAPFTLQPNTLATGALTTGAADQIFTAKSNGLIMDTAAGWDFLGFGPQCYNFAQMMFIINSPAKSLESASLGEAGWVVTFLLNVENFSTTFAAITERAVMDWLNNLTFSRSTLLPWGAAFTSADNGSTAFIGIQLSSDYPVTQHTFIADGTALTFTLDLTPAAASANAVMINKNGAATPLAYTTDYTVNLSTKVVTLVAAGTTGDKYVVTYKHLATC